MPGPKRVPTPPQYHRVPQAQGTRNATFQKLSMQLNQTDFLNYFRTFNVSGLQAKGQTAFCYGDYGFSFTGSVEVDILSFFNQFLVGFSIVASVEGGFSIAKKSLLLGQVFPYRISYIGDGPSCPVYYNVNKISLIDLFGKHYKGNLTLAINPKLEAPLPILYDELGFSLEFSTQAQIGGEVELLTLKPTYQGVFPSLQSDKFCNYCDLELAVNRLLGNVPLEDLKRFTLEWIDEIKACFSAPSRPLRSRMFSFLFNGKKEKIIPGVYSVFEKALNAKLNGIFELNIESAEFKTWLQKMCSQSSTKNIVRSLNELHTTVKSNRSNFLESDCNSILKTIIDLQRLFYYRLLPGIEVRSGFDIIPHGESVFKLFSVSGTANASAIAEGKISVGVAEAGGSVSASAAVNAKYLQYRFQTKNDSLMYTQDTSMVLKSLKLEAGGATYLTKLDLPARNAKSGYNTICYKSIGLYWNSKKRDILKGSGVSFGLSVSREKLGSLKLDSSLVKALCKQLKIKIEQQQVLIDFINESGVLKMQGLDTVFIESNLMYNLTRSLKVPIGYGSEHNHNTSFLKYPYLNNQSMLLSALRIRVRQNDFINRGGSLFKLGFSAFNTGIFVDFSRVREGGMNNMVDISVKPFKLDSSDPVLNEEFSVNPVVIPFI